MGSNEIKILLPRSTVRVRGSANKLQTLYCNSFREQDFWSGRLSRFGHGTCRSWYFGLETFRSHYEILQKSFMLTFLMPTYLNQRKVLFK